MGSQDTLDQLEAAREENIRLEADNRRLTAKVEEHRIEVVRLRQVIIDKMTADRGPDCGIPIPAVAPGRDHQCICVHPYATYHDFHHCGCGETW